MCNVTDYVEGFKEGASDMEMNCFDYLVDHLGYDEEDAVSEVDNVIIWEGSAEEYAVELVHDCYDIDNVLDSLGNLKYWVEIDYKGIARDMEINGEIFGLEENLWVVNHIEF